MSKASGTHDSQFPSPVLANCIHVWLFCCVVLIVIEAGELERCFLLLLRY